jgi:NAD(P)H-flavin reductase
MKTVRIFYFKEITDEQQKKLLEDRLEEIKAEGQVNLLTVIEPGGKTNHVKNHQQRQFSKEAGPYVNKSAVVGAAGMIKVALAGVKMITGRDVKAFDNEVDAVKWIES